MSSQPPAYPAYGPYSNPFNPKSSLSINTSKAELINDSDARYATRKTPSPTQKEFNFLNDIKEKKTIRETIQYYAIIAVLLAFVILFSVFHVQIIHALKPFTDWLHNTKVGPFVIIAILIILSFPPLFGHEIIAMLAGVAWDFPEACLVVAVGTILGEFANYFVFKNACSVRGAKMEEKDISYGILAHVVRNGGFLIVLVIRYSAIPLTVRPSIYAVYVALTINPVATAVFSTVGVSFLTFAAAALLSLPKTFVPVYVGYALKPENADNKTSEKIEKVVLVATIIVTIAAYSWVNRQMKAVKADYIYLRRKGRQAKASSNGGAVFIGLPDVTA